jgi:hypothetical protein
VSSTGTVNRTPYDDRRYGPGGCAEVIEQLAMQIDAGQFNPQFGDLDGLSGLYAAVNALRRLAPEYEDRDDIWREIFALLLMKSEECQSTYRTIAQGLSSRTIRSMLRDAGPTLECEFGLRFDLRIPALDKALPAVTARLAHHTQESWQAVLAARSEAPFCWMVVTEIEANRAHVVAPDLPSGSQLDLIAIDPASIIILRRVSPPEVTSI